jgi:hypothetical protein
VCAKSFAIILTPRVRGFAARVCWWSGVRWWGQAIRDRRDRDWEERVGEGVRWKDNDCGKDYYWTLDYGVDSGSCL